jgi:hypothetical protein
MRPGRILGVNTVAKAGTKAYISETSHMNPTSRQAASRPVPRFFHPLFWPILALTVVVGLIEWNDQQVLGTDSAPYGMLSLALGGHADKDTAIVRQWHDSIPDTSPKDFCAAHPDPIIPILVAKPAILLDLGFVVLYSALLVLFLGYLQANDKGTPSGDQSPRTPAGAWLTKTSVVIAAICAIITDIGMLDLVAGSRSESLAVWTRIAALAMLVILALLAVYILFILFFRHPVLKTLTGYTQRKTLQLFRYRVILLGVLFFSVPIWALDQGQDLLVNSNSGNAGIVLFVGVVLIAAALNWWLAKLFFTKGFQPGEHILPLSPPAPPTTDELLNEKKVSRFLGICTILIPATAILNALRAIRMHYWGDQFNPMSWLCALLIGFFVLIRYECAERLYDYAVNKWGDKAAKFLTHSLLLLLAFLLPLIIRFTILSDDHRSPYSLNFLYLQLLLLAVAFYLFVSLRTRLYANHHQQTRQLGAGVLVAAGLLAAGFLLYNIFPFATTNWDGCFLSLPVLLSGIVFYTLVITLLLRLGLAKKVNFLLFIVVIGIALAIKGNNHYHDVRLMAVKTAPQRDSLADYFRGWLLSRQHDIDGAKGEYPIFLVNSYGGGIRAAAYTNMVFSYLDDTLRRQGGFGKSFEHYVFSVSGASGGSIGAAVQCAWHAAHPDGHPDTNYRNDLASFYQHDFLTPVLSNMLGSDVWASPLGVSLWRDRSAIQEALWARYGRGSLNLALDAEFNSLWDTSRANPSQYEIPLLFSNTLNVDDGNKGICAPVDLSHRDFPATVFIRERIDALNAHRGGKADSLQSISLITGAFLSARFPYISPSGKMGPGYHFMDGGAKDNSGASTSECIFLALSRWAMQTAQTDTLVRRLMRNVHFYFVSISNNPRASLDEQPDPRLLVSNRWEPISPVVGIINSGIDGNATAADSILRFRYSGPAFPGDSMRADYCAIWPMATCIDDGGSHAYCPLLPLGWQISEPSLTRLNTCFTPGNIVCNPVGICMIMKVCRRL